jgi:frataxin-like iron-binding protein CyaY
MFIAEKLSGKKTGQVVHTTTPECEDYVEAMKQAIKIERDMESNIVLLQFEDNSKIIILKE